MRKPGEPYKHPAAWRGPDMVAREEWLHHLDDGDIEELDAALAHALAIHAAIPALAKDQFPIPRLARKLEGILREVEDGRGFALLRGLPVSRYGKRHSALIYWGIGTHLGTFCAQNAQGDVLGHVRDLGANWQKDMKARGYQTRAHLPFHSDSTDLVGLLCLNTARMGGESRIISSVELHNEILRQRPDLWKTLCEQFYFDRRGEQAEDDLPYYPQPCFNFLDGRLFVKYNRTYIDSAQRFPDVPRLSVLQREALDFVDSLCNDPAFYLDMEFQPGDMQFINNYVVLHSRATYEDWPEPERKRHLLRLWLRTPSYKELPAGFAARNSDMAGWLANPRPPIFDTTELQAELAH